MNLPSQLLKRADDFLASGDLEKVDQLLDAWENLRTGKQLYSNGRGPDNAEANVLQLKNSDGEITYKMVLYKGAFEAYKNGSPARRDLGYFIDLQPGLHAIRGLLGHELGHMVPSLVFDGDGNLKPNREANAERFLQTLYPNEYPGSP